MVVGGLAFKLALVPCHAWAPDVYQGSPTPVTAFLSVVPKGAALIVLLRLAVGMDLVALSPRWVIGTAIIAVASQILGNLVAIVQRDVKRMLAYSGIAHMGYALVAVIVAGRGRRHGSARLLRRLHPDEHGRLRRDRADVRARGPAAPDRRPQGTGLQPPDGGARPHGLPVFARRLPPFLGFTAKFMVFRAAVNAGFVWLAVIGVLNSLLSAFYYLRVIYALYMEPLPEREPRLEPSLPIAAVATIAALGVLVLGPTRAPCSTPPRARFSVW